MKKRTLLRCKSNEVIELDGKDKFVEETELDLEMVRRVSQDVDIVEVSKRFESGTWEEATTKGGKNPTTHMVEHVRTMNGVDANSDLTVR